MSLSEELAHNLNAKVQRINVLQKLVLQPKINLGAKALGKVSEAEISVINEEVREFLLEMLAKELGNYSEPDPFAQIGIEMTEEKADALDEFLSRLVAKRQAIEPPPAPVSESTTSPATELPPPSPRVNANSPKILSPVLTALKASAGGEDEWNKLPADERARRVKELERQSSISYTSTTK